MKGGGGERSREFSLLTPEPLPHPGVWTLPSSPPQPPSRTGHHCPSPEGLKGPLMDLLTATWASPETDLEMCLKLCDSLSQKPSLASHYIQNKINEILTTTVLCDLAPTHLICLLAKLQRQWPGPVPPGCQAFHLRSPRVVHMPRTLSPKSLTA